MHGFSYSIWSKLWVTWTEQNHCTVIYTITPLSERKDWSTKQEVASALLVYITVLISLRVQPSATVV